MFSYELFIICVVAILALAACLKYTFDLKFQVIRLNEKNERQKERMKRLVNARQRLQDSLEQMLELKTFYYDEKINFEKVVQQQKGFIRLNERSIRELQHENLKIERELKEVSVELLKANEKYLRTIEILKKSRQQVRELKNKSHIKRKGKRA